MLSIQQVSRTIQELFGKCPGMTELVTVGCSSSGIDRMDRLSRTLSAVFEIGGEFKLKGVGLLRSSFMDPREVRSGGLFKFKREGFLRSSFKEPREVCCGGLLGVSKEPRELRRGGLLWSSKELRELCMD
jgi:hypothetical protein